MGRLICDGNSVYELDEEALALKQKKKMEQYPLDDTRQKNNSNKDKKNSAMGRKKKGTV